MRLLCFQPSPCCGVSQRLLEEQQAREAHDMVRKRMRQGSSSGSGSSSAVADALAQLREESAGDADMLVSLDRVQAVLEGRAENTPVADQRHDNKTAEAEPGTGGQLL